MQRHTATRATESNDRAGPTADPFGVDVPEGWTRSVDVNRTVYEADDADVRVEIRELSRRLSLYWWVNVYERVGGEWTRRDVGVEATFRDSNAAAAAAQTVVDAADAGQRPAQMDVDVNVRAAEIPAGGDD